MLVGTCRCFEIYAHHSLMALIVGNLLKEHLIYNLHACLFGTLSNAFTDPCSLLPCIPPTAVAIGSSFMAYQGQMNVER
jgi:hypothetical protein